MDDTAIDQRTVLLREWREIRKRRNEGGSDEVDVPPKDLIGLALSGGGIRSATFCLGVLQALREQLRSFD